VIFGVFELLMQRNGRKRDNIKSKGKDKKQVFFPLLFLPLLPAKKLPKTQQDKIGKRCSKKNCLPRLLAICQIHLFFSS
jgi:hypothetical protein